MSGSVAGPSSRSTKPSGAETRTLNILVCTQDHAQTACGHLRIFGPLACSPDVSVRGFRHATFLRDLSWADLVLVQRAFPSASRKRHLDTIHRTRKPLLYETDDPLHLFPDDHPDGAEIAPAVQAIAEVVARADALVLSTHGLAAAFPSDKLRIVVENSLDESLWPRAAIPEREEPIRIVFGGTPSHRDDLALCEEALLRLLDVHGSGVSLTLMGCSLPSLEAREQVATIPFTPDYAAYARSLRALRPHIGIVPLRDIPFNRTKSAIKWLELSATGVAGIYSDLLPYQGVVEEGVTGLRVGPSPEEWFQALDSLVRDHDRRCAIARCAQDAAIRDHAMSARGLELASSLRKIREDLARAGRSGSSPGLWTRLRYLLDL